MHETFCWSKSRPSLMRDSDSLQYVGIDVRQRGLSAKTPRRLDGKC